MYPPKRFSSSFSVRTISQSGYFSARIFLASASSSGCGVPAQVSSAQRGIEIDKQFHYTVQNPTLNRARNIAEELLELYRKEELDEVYIIYTSMVNAIQEETQIRQLLPLKKASFNVKLPADIPMEELALKPSPEAVMDRIVPDYVVGFIYGALVESYSCEQNARMMAMEAATKSAKDMLHELDILYNRARQAAITQEITEVIAGAKAQKRKKRQ